MNTFLAVLGPALAAVVGLYMFARWWTALMYLGVMVAIAWLAVRQHEKHHASDMFDDRLTTERMEQSREWLVNKWDED